MRHWLGLIAKFFILIILIVSSSGCIRGTAPNGIICPVGCGYCNNTACTSCCYSYYMAPSGACIPCSDAQCQYCSYDTSEYCYYCYSGYGLSPTNRISCLACTVNTALNCQSVNNCNATNNCADCPWIGINPDGICKSCNLIYRNCDECNNSQCLYC